MLLPPSEGKTAPRRGKPLALDSLSFPGLTSTRARLLEAVQDLCRSDPEHAADVLGLPGTRRDLVDQDAVLDSAPTARADAVYTGVLYDAWAPADASTAARRRSAIRVAVTSGLFGLLRPGDRVPAYRLSGDVRLPDLGPVAGLWREVLGEAALDAVGRGLLVDLRSGTYTAFWRPTGLGDRLATVRVLQERDGKRSVVSHFNKATKGRLVRALLEDGRDPRTAYALADLLTELGWHVETVEEREGVRLDVVVTEV